MSGREILVISGGEWSMVIPFEQTGVDGHRALL